jgi:uncharacterized membrane protein
MDHKRDFFEPKTTLDKFFEVGVLLKAFDGLVEIVTGLILLFIRPELIVHWAKVLTDSELSEDPHDIIASHIVHWANGFTKGAAIFASLYLLSHGLIKVVLVFEVLRNRLWAYPALIIVTAAFVVYQLYSLIHKPTAGLILLTILDVAVIYLTAREYAKQRRLREQG